MITYTTNDSLDYIAKNLSNEENMVSNAVDLMRYVEDQFVVWGEYPKWSKVGWGAEPLHYPAGLEQYDCYVPIDSSTATIMTAFTNLYKLKGDRLYLEKAMALADMITRVQNPETGCIPTFWMGENCAYGYKNFWINCMQHTAYCMMCLGELTEKEGLD